MIEEARKIDGDMAHCETYDIGAMLLRNMKSTILLIGRYIDRLERRGGGGRIALRRTVVDTAPGAHASFLQTRMVAGFPKGLWTKDDPSNRNPLEFGPEVERWSGAAA